MSSIWGGDRTSPLIISVIVAAVAGIGVLLLLPMNPGNRIEPSKATQADKARDIEDVRNNPGTSAENANKPFPQTAFATGQRIPVEAQEKFDSYEYVIGESIPPTYLAIRDHSRLSELAASGDRFAAKRLGDLMLNETGDVDGAIEAYRRAAELGSPAALTSIAALLEPDENMFNSMLRGKFGIDPKANPGEAYLYSRTALMMGHRSAHFVLSRASRHIAPSSIAALDRLALDEYERLDRKYISMHGRALSLPLDPEGEAAFHAALEAN